MKSLDIYINIWFTSFMLFDHKIQNHLLIFKANVFTDEMEKGITEAAVLSSIFILNKINKSTFLSKFPKHGKVLLQANQLR